MSSSTHSVSRDDYALVPLTTPKPGRNVKSVQQGATPNDRDFPQNHAYKADSG